MIRTDNSFYVTGGTLRDGAPCYVERHADRDLFASLKSGEFCYVLTARQMGKSSLMVRTAARLRADGVSVVMLDLTAIGQNLSAEQWYDGLLRSLSPQIALEKDIEAFWLANPRLGPLQRWMAALQQIVLPKIAPGSLVIFVDEIDVVRSLPFSTDEFFAAIRECYNRRSSDPELNRLTFCLLGVATPSDLIRDTRMTPFNIGRRIELNDFTEAEAAPLAKGLRTGKNVSDVSAALLKRVLFWTNGHPYLTQRLCRALSEAPNPVKPVSVDLVCHDLFLSNRARERDDNLLFVRERMLRNEADMMGLLNLYERVRRGRERVRDDPADPFIGILKLAGIVRTDQSNLSVRNRIYFEVFDRAWIRDNKPEADLRRQKEAFRRGVIRSAVAGGAITLIACLAGYGLHQADRAKQMAEEQSMQRLRADETQRRLSKSQEEAAEARARQERDAFRTRKAEELSAKLQSANEALQKIMADLTNNEEVKMALENVHHRVDQAAVPEFWRVPAINALVILNSFTNFNPNGVTNVSRLVVRDIPFLQMPEFQAIVAPYLLNPFTEMTMKKLQHDIIRYYLENGGPPIQVTFPEQDVSNGNLQLVVLEGAAAAANHVVADFPSISSLTPAYTNSLNMVFVRWRNDYYVGQWEVSQAQYQTVMGATMASTNLLMPVTVVPFAQAINFCANLTARDQEAHRNDPGWPFAGWAYELPTEKEWWSFANPTPEMLENSVFSVNRLEPPQSTGLYTRNSQNNLGIYDLFGNVAEWCWGTNYQSIITIGGQSKSKKPSLQVVNASMMRVSGAYLTANVINRGSETTGFRCVFKTKTAP